MTEKHRSEPRSESIRRKPDIYTDIFVRKIPTAYETGT